MFNKPLQDCLNLLYRVSSTFHGALFWQILQGYRHLQKHILTNKHYVYC